MPVLFDMTQVANADLGGIDQDEYMRRFKEHASECIANAYEYVLKLNYQRILSFHATSTNFYSH